MLRRLSGVRASGHVSRASGVSRWRVPCPGRALVLVLERPRLGLSRLHAQDNAAAIAPLEPPQCPQVARVLAPPHLVACELDLAQLRAEARPGLDRVAKCLLKVFVALRVPEGVG
jgi:hypothetical protein